MISALPATLMSPVVSGLRVSQTHDFPHVAHRLLGELPRPLAAVGHDRAHERRIVEELLRALLDRLLLGDDRVDDRLLAFEAADARGRAAFLYPALPFVVGVDLVQAPHRTLFRRSRI